MVAVLIALLSSVFWGVSDVLGGIAARGSTVLRATAWAYLGATVTMLIVVMARSGEWSTAMLVAATVAGVTNVLGLLAFYAAFASGPMGPMGAIVGATQAVVPVVAAVIWKHETLGLVAFAGMGIAILGSVLIGIAEGRGAGRATFRPIIWAVIAGLFFGSTVTALGMAPHSAGLLTPAVEMVIGLGIIGVLLLAVRGSTRIGYAFGSIGSTRPGAQPSRRAIGIAVIGGVVLAAANSTEVLALQAGSLAAVGVVISLYPVTTAVLAWVFLKEHLRALHLIGIAAALGGCALLALS
ncbi:MAG: DMT family transporter [Arthrobacter sp.]|jgi:drug/metabolite transporter (DMT)-like permease|nr:DMT family transporter [Arthrobacter sp.]